MKNILDMFIHNWLWKLSALAFAIGLWFICMNTIGDEPRTESLQLTLTIRNIDQLAENNIVIQNQQKLENTKINLRVSGKFSDIQALTRDTAALAKAAYIDMSVIDMRYSKEMGVELPAYVRIQLPNTVKVIEKDPETVPVMLDKYVTRGMSVSINSIGEPAQDYKALDGVSTPETVRVSGPQTLLNQISQIRVDVDITGAAEEIVASAPPKAYDSNNQEITGITIDPGTVDIVIPVEKRGKISISRPQYSGDPAPGYTVVDVEWEPKYAQVIGSEEDIQNAPPILIPPGELSIEGWTETGTREYDLRNYLYEHGQDISIENGTPQRVTMTVIIEPLVQKSFEVPVSKLTIKGLTRGVEFIGDTVPITLEGRESLMEKMTEDDIAGSLSLINLAPGEHTVPVIFAIPSGIAVIGDTPAVTIIIPEIQESTEPAVSNGPASEAPNTSGPDGVPAGPPER